MTSANANVAPLVPMLVHGGEYPSMSITDLLRLRHGVKGCEVAKSSPIGLLGTAGYAEGR